jgi:hypothetical protein
MELLASGSDKVTLQLTREELQMLIQLAEDQESFIPDYRHQMKQFARLFHMVWSQCFDGRAHDTNRRDLAWYKKQLDQEHEQYLQRLKNLRVPRKKAS